MAKNISIKSIGILISSIVTFLSLVVVFVCPVSAFSLKLDTIKNLSSDPIDSSTPSVAADGKNLYLAWQSGDFFSPCTNCHILYRRSIDGGINWEPSVDKPPLNLSETIANSFSPKVAVSGNLVAVVWISYNRTNGENAFNGDLFLRRSFDGGNTFEPVQELRSGPVSNPQVVISDSILHIMWLERETYWPFPTNVFYTRSVDQGLNFEVPISLSEGHPYPYSNEQAQISASGQYVGVVWINGSNPSPIVFKGSNDSGSSFRPLLHLSESLPNGEAPQVSIDDKNVQVTWKFKGNVYHRNSIDGGVNFSPLKNLSYTSQTGFPRLVAEDGMTYVVWPDINGMKFRRSVDEGNSFESSINLTKEDMLGTVPSIAAHNQVVAVAWNTVTGGSALQSDVQFRYSNDGGKIWNPPLGSPAEYVSTKPQQNRVAPQVFTDGPNFYFFWLDRESGHYDILFRRASTEVSPSFSLGFPLKGLSPGNASINSVFDHSMKNKKGKYMLYGTSLKTDKIVTAYTNETGIRIDETYEYLSVGCYKNPSDKKKKFFINGHYTAARFPKKFLCYDGHPGIDFRAANLTEVYASVSGTINYPKNMVGLRDPLKVAYKNFHVLELIPDDFPDYRIYYLHLYTHPAAKVSVTKNVANPGCPSEVTLPLPNGTHVSKGCLIALAGDAGSPNQPHLHFEVQKLVPLMEVKEITRDYLKCVYIPDKACVPVDPYGWESTEIDPYLDLTNVTNVRLWD